MKRSLILAAACLLALAFASGTFAQAPRQRTDRGAWRREAVNFWQQEEMIARLGLTPAQRTQLDGIAERFQEETAELQAELREARGEFNALIGQQDLNRYELETLIREVVDLQARITQLNMERQIAIREVLTAEQHARVGTARRTRAARAAEERSRTRDRSEDDSEEE